MLIVLVKEMQKYNLIQ